MRALRIALTSLTGAALMGMVLWTFFTTDQTVKNEQKIFMLMFVVVLPMLMVKLSGWLRPVFLLGSLIFFGFLLWSCPRFPGPR